MKSDPDDLSMLIDENKTRKKLIDPILKQRGWYKQYIKEEVNSVRSDFAAKQFSHFEGNFQKGVDGFTLDDKRTRIDGKGDIPDILDKFGKRDSEKFEDRKAKCFFVPFEEIKENDYDLSLSKYKEIEYEEIEYEEPELILEKIGGLEDKIKTGVDDLMEMLKEK